MRGSSNKDDYAVWNCDRGVATGAIVINFPAPTIPVGIRVTYDGVEYTTLSAAVTGQRGPASAGELIVVGETGSQCPQLPGTFNLNNLVPNGGVWVTSSGSTSITHSAPNLSISPSIGNMVMVIHKPNATPSNLKVELTAPCGGGTSLDVSVACAQTLPATQRGRVETTASAACGGSLSGRNAYFVHTDGTVGGQPQLHSFAFDDAAASAPLAQGWYKYDDGSTSGGRYNVGANGIITAIGTCP